VTDDRPGVGQMDGKQRKLLCHKGVLTGKRGGAAKATNIRNYHFRDRFGGWHGKARIDICTRVMASTKSKLLCANDIT
jgi:hypothetical protein